jgi:hypothetical protein
MPMGTGVSDGMRLPALNKTGHVAHCVRCLDGLPASLVEMDASRYVPFFPHLPLPDFLSFKIGVGLGLIISEWLLRFIV